MLEILQFNEENTNREAKCHYIISESFVKDWYKPKAKLVRQNAQEMITYLYNVLDQQVKSLITQTLNKAVTYTVMQLITQRIQYLSFT